MLAPRHSPTHSFYFCRLATLLPFCLQTMRGSCSIHSSITICFSFSFVQPTVDGVCTATTAAIIWENVEYLKRISTIPLFHQHTRRNDLSNAFANATHHQVTSAGLQCAIRVRFSLSMCKIEIRRAWKSEECCFVWCRCIAIEGMKTKGRRVSNVNDEWFYATVIWMIRWIVFLFLMQHGQSVDRYEGC